MARRINKSKTIFTSIVSFILGLAIGFVVNIYLAMPNSYVIPASVDTSVHSTATTGKIDTNIVKDQDLSIHFLELGNKYTGDCTLIKVGNTEMLIDAGSKASSASTIKEYLDIYVTDNTLEYVVVTHAHEDHYAGFATNDEDGSIFDYYTIGTIIEFAKTNKTTANKQFLNYTNQKNDAVSDYGTKIYSAMDYFKTGTSLNSTFELETGSGIYCQILYHKFYEEVAETENDYSVCLQIVQGEKKYLFTGDLESEGEQSLVDPANTHNAGKLSQVELYKAGHHGSKTSSSAELMSVIKPKIVCVCCCAGSSEYTSKSANQFPTQAFIDRVSIYTKQIFVTTLCEDYKQNKFKSFNGNIVVCSNMSDTNTAVYCSNNTTYLKDTDWFKANRTLPQNAVA